MKKKVIVACVVVVALGLLGLAIGTGVLTGKILPALGKALSAVPPKTWGVLLFKLLVLTGLMSYVTKLVNARKERFLNGETDYDLQDDYVLIVGYDFQTRSLIKRLLAENPVGQRTWLGKFCSGSVIAVKRFFGPCYPAKCILLVTDRDVRTIRAELTTELTKEEYRRVLYMRRDLALERTYEGLRMRGAKAIYLMGDEGMPGRDGIILQASKIIAEKVRKEKTDAPCPAGGGVRELKTFLQFEDPSFYAQMCSEHLPMDPETDKNNNVILETVLFDLEVFNYYDSWVWKCWSEKDSTDEDARYLPLRFKPDAERVELFVIGEGRATKAVVDAAVTLMNYGKDGRTCRLTVVSDRALEVVPSDEIVSALPELEVVAFLRRELTREVAARMLQAHSSQRTAVTVVITEDAPEQSVRTYMGFPFALRCSDDVSVLMWMGAQSRSLPDKSLVVGTGAHKPQVRYFGMSNIMPWYGSRRQAVGADVNYYYSVRKQLPKGEDPALASAALRLWNEGAAFDAWDKSPRWGKNSSINSAGSYKEKAALVNGRKIDSELLRQLLKAEHNRWWSERLLSDWRFAEKRDDSRRLHPNMVPFEDLDAPTQDIDKINIAAMARQGFIG